MQKPLMVTEPYLPSLAGYQTRLTGIWERNWLTNQGPLVRELEQKLQAHHDVPFPLHCVVNGAIGLQLIIKALGLRGEIITTPFSYIATAAAARWEGHRVVFADIEPDYLTLDPAAVEAAITPRTEAILATHVFGNPCDVEALDAIGKKHGLAVIYDAAHAFGVTYKGKSLLSWGDASMVSTHATKLFHTIEGGFICAPNGALARKMEWMRRFGHDGAERFHGIGTNAKMSEVHAAMGLSVLDEITTIFEQRRRLVELYDAALADIDCVRPAMILRAATGWNWSYYPVLCESESDVRSLMEQFHTMQIFPRRYFHPALHRIPELQSDSSTLCPVAERIARTILCLPLAASYQAEHVDRVVETLKIIDHRKQLTLHTTLWGILNTLTPHLADPNDALFGFQQWI
jgi:dTDP-4-amino-4,6-dideoxygalactose transaminase